MIDPDKNEKDGTIPREAEGDGGNRDNEGEREKEMNRVGARGREREREKKRSYSEARRKTKSGSLARGRKVEWRKGEERRSERGWSTLRVIKSRPSRSPLYPPRLYIPPRASKEYMHSCVRW